MPDFSDPKTWGQLRPRESLTITQWQNNQVSMVSEGNIGEINSKAPNPKKTEEKFAAQHAEGFSGGIRRGFSHSSKAKKQPIPNHKYGQERKRRER